MIEHVIVIILCDIVYIYIYTILFRRLLHGGVELPQHLPAVARAAALRARTTTANLPTNIVGFGGFDSSIMSIVRGGIPRPIADSRKV